MKSAQGVLVTPEDYVGLPGGQSKPSKLEITECRKRDMNTGLYRQRTVRPVLMCLRRSLCSSKTRNCERRCASRMLGLSYSPVRQFFILTCQRTSAKTDIATGDSVMCFKLRRLSRCGRCVK